MSFGFGGGGFGTNNTTSSSSFGGFGATAGSGFGSGTGFGSSTNNASGGLFGGAPASNTGTGFGGSAGFGSSNNTSTSLFGGGNKTSGFGSTTTSGGGMFGGTTATSNNNTFSGFGGTSNPSFGSTSGGAFGAGNKPTFGGGTSGGLFGNTGTSSAGFGATTGTTNPGGFGSSTTAFGASTQNNGTANVQFTPFIEKEASSNASAAYQSITAMDPYKKFSTEELRTVDYAQGRKYGNSSGQAGSFGTSTGFGGFGSSQPAANSFGATSTSGGAGLFGASGGTSNSLFGGGASGTGAFGSGSAGGGLFGAKPAATGGFGSTTTATTAAASGGLFGTSGGGFGSSTGAFGNNNNTTAATGGFGANNQNKAFGGFGSNPSTGGFGGGASTTSSLFANPTATGGFGANNTQNSSSGGFGNFGQQNQQQTQGSGGLFGGFGANNQQKPGGLFGSTAAAPGGGLFGQQNQPQQSGALFGNNNNNTQGGGLFGNKPASGGLFGAPASNPASGGLFGNQQPAQQNAGTGLFGSSNNQQGGGLFGAKPAATSGGLFGSSMNQQQQGSTGLFGSTQQQPAQGNSMFGSQNSQSQQNHLVATLTENPYGNAQLFTGLQTPTQSLGPLATPLSSSQKNRKQAVIPQYRLMPHASSRLITPQKRPPGYGFSYSTYNSPVGSVGSGSPLGLGSSLLGGRSLGKSLSTSNLRNSFTAQDSILAPGAFNSASQSGGPGSMKKLNINRNLTARRSLFGTESTSGALTKRVSFENGGTPVHESYPDISGALVRTETPEPIVEQTPEQPTNGASSGRELAVVPEHPAPVQPEMSEAPKTRSQKEPVIGDYITTPSISELKTMTKEQLAKIQNFTVERDGVGKIVFFTTNLSTVPLDQIVGQIVQLETRRATVYGDNSPVKKPARGQGLNVPSRITLENSWPRAKSSRLLKVPEANSRNLERHIKLLKKCNDTTFVSYDDEKGVWVFDVEHYTTYGLDYDEDETGDVTMSEYPSVADINVPKSRLQHLQQTPQLSSYGTTSSSEAGVDDTFEFKRHHRVRLPGQFDEDDFIADLIPDSPESLVHRQEASDELIEVPEDVALDQDMDVEIEEMPGALPAAEPLIIRDSSRASSVEGTEDMFASRLESFSVGSDWTKQLTKLRRENQQRKTLGKSAGQIEGSAEGYGTTIDIMNSLFPPASTKESEIVPRPDSRHVNIATLPATMDPILRRAPEDICDLSYAGKIMQVQYKHTILNDDKTGNVELPLARTVPSDALFGEFASVANSSTPQGTTTLECDIWRLAAVLFDTHNLPAPYFTPNTGSSIIPPVTPSKNVQSRYRKDLFIDYWKTLIASEVTNAVRVAATPEDRAFAHLTGGDLTSACKALVEGRDFKLATLIAQLPANDVFRQTMDRQIRAWDDLNVTSEFTDVIRAMYGILAGRTMKCEGKSGGGVPIEDRSSTFYLSQKFNMSWRRSFGLKLFWGLLREEDLGTAVQLFEADVEAGEPADPENDPLWAILKLYTVKQDESANGGLAKLLDWSATMPEDFDRLAFQFASILASNDNQNGLDFKTLDTIIVDGPVLQPLLEKMRAELATDEQHACALFFRAVFIALHVRSTSQRESILARLLTDNADLIVRFNCGSQLVSKLGIPAKLIGEAKARVAKEVGDVESEIEGLVEAGDAKQAMDRLFGDILPGLAIRGDLKGMKRIMGNGLLPFMGPEGTHGRMVDKYKSDMDFYVAYLTIVGDGKKVKGAERTGLVKKFKEELERRKEQMDGIAWRVMKVEVESL